MALDDSKYILQLARADVLSLPPTPGDWSVQVKPPDADYNMGDHENDNGPAKIPGTSEGNTARLKGAVSAPRPSDNANPQAGQHSPGATTAARIHSRETSRDTESQTWTQPRRGPTPDGSRRPASSPRSPPTQQRQKYYRMALVSAIQPSFGTDADSMNRDDGEEQRTRGSSAPQTE